ncbi:MAG: hypothetical protein JF609_04980 [Verrucomicrobia bacterium]|nr:hypothetical protein [Verrucomicrobiota bacterium]
MKVKYETENCFAWAEPSSMGTQRVGGGSVRLRQGYGATGCRLRHCSSSAVQNRAGQAAIPEKVKITKQSQILKSIRRYEYEA